MRGFPFTFNTITIKGEAASPATGCFLWLVLSGELFYEGDFGGCRLSTASVMFIPMGESGHVIPSGDNLILALRFDPIFFSDNMGQEKAPILCNSELRSGDYDDIRRKMSLAAEAYYNCGSRDALKVMSLVYELMHSLYINFSLSAENAGHLEQQWVTDRRVALERYIRRNYREAFTLADLAEKFHLSYQYLSKYFKRTFGTNFIDYIRDVRLQCAVNDIKNGVSVTAAAIDNGFSSISAFNRAFKNKYGMTPTAYIAMEKEAVIRFLPDTFAIRDYSESKGLISKFLPAPDPGGFQEAAVRMEVDADCASDTPIRHSWSEILNLENAESCLDYTFQGHVRKVQQDIGFKYGRVKGVLNESVFPGLWTSAFFDVTVFTRIIDFLLSAGLIPFIELSPRKSADSSGVPFSSAFAAKYEWALKELFSYCVKRWGEDEIEKWRFSLCFCRTGPAGGDGVKPYCRIFRTAQSILQSYIVNGKLGGMDMDISASSTALLEDIFSQLKQARVTPDFFTMRMFPAYHGVSEGDLKTREKRLIYRDEDALSDRIDRVNRTVYKYFPEIDEIYITEFNSTDKPMAPINETEHQSAYIIRAVIENCDKVSGMGYWHLSDLSCGNVKNNVLLFGGSGMFTRNGIRKNSYHAIKLLDELGSRMISRGPNHIITHRSRGHIEVLMHNCKYLSLAYCSEYSEKPALPEDEILYDELHLLNIHISLTNLRKGTYMLKTCRVDKEHGNISHVASVFNSNYILRNEETEYLYGICVPLQQLQYGRNTGTIELDATLKPNEVRLVCIVFEELT